jgi:hypothetical protein
MVLEESLVFFNDEDADRFIRFLREKGCPAQKKHEGEAVEEEILKGTFNDLIALYEEVEARCRARQQECTGSPEKNPDAQSPDESDEDSPEFCEEAGQQLENLKKFREDLRKIMVDHNAGDILCSEDTLNRLGGEMQEFKRNSVGNSGKHESLRQNMQFLLFIAQMDMMGLVEKRPEGIILKQKTDPGELVIERGMPESGTIEPGLFARHHVTCFTTTIFDTETRVVIDPRIHFTCEPEEVFSVVRDLEVDGESARKFFDNLSNKCLAVDLVLKIIRDAGRVTLTEIIREMGMTEWEHDEGEAKITVRSSPAFVIRLVNDLKKIGFIEGPDQKLRLAKERKAGF